MLDGGWNMDGLAPLSCRIRPLSCSTLSVAIAQKSFHSTFLMHGKEMYVEGIMVTNATASRALWKSRPVKARLLWLHFNQTSIHSARVS
jgi:hypothetical protein